MAVYERTNGKKAGARAVLHPYDGLCKIEITVGQDIAKQMLEVAVDKGGEIHTHILFDGVSHDCKIIGARIDSLDDHSKPIGVTGVIAFASLARRK